MPALTGEKKQLVESHLSYVRAIAARLKEHLPRDVEFEDLVAYGTQGLIEAAERYDGKLGTAFSTFSYYRVRGAIFDGLRRMGWLPRGEYARGRVDERADLYLSALAARDVGAARYGDPDDEPSLDDEVHQLASALDGVAAIFIASLTQQDEDQLLDPSLLPPEQLEQRQIVGRVREALSSLPEKERRLIELYYFEEKTLLEAGAQLGLSKSWTSRLHARAIDLLQAELARDFDAMQAERDVVDGRPRKRRRANAS